MAAKQTTRDKHIFVALSNVAPYIANHFFKGAHWERVPNSPFDETQNSHAIIYAAQSAAITVLAWNYNGDFKIQIIGW